MKKNKYKANLKKKKKKKIKMIFKQEFGQYRRSFYLIYFLVYFHFKPEFFIEVVQQKIKKKMKSYRWREIYCLYFFLKNIGGKSNLVYSKKWYKTLLDYYGERKLLCFLRQCAVDFFFSSFRASNQENSKNKAIKVLHKEEKW